MAQWLVKQLSTLTQVSVRTLHYYDKIEILKPSVRSSNGYRWYTQQDLVKLQQIVALKYFGFSLDEIKSILQDKPRMIEHFIIQQHMLQEKISHLQNAQEALQGMISDVLSNNTLDWNRLITSIERYKMSEQTNKNWEEQSLNAQQKKVFLELKQEFPKEFDLWEKTIELINNKKVENPFGAQGKRIVELFLDITKKVKSTLSKQRKFNADILRSIKQGTITELPLSPEGNLWLTQAAFSYWSKRWDEVYQEILANLESDPKGSEGKKVVDMWQKVLDESFTGSNQDYMTGIIMWQDTARQLKEYKELKVAPSPQEMVKKLHVPLFFNPEALGWVEKAFATHNGNE